MTRAVTIDNASVTPPLHSPSGPELRQTGVHSDLTLDEFDAALCAHRGAAVTLAADVRRLAELHNEWLCETTALCSRPRRRDVLRRAYDLGVRQVGEDLLVERITTTTYGRYVYASAAKKHDAELWAACRVLLPASGSVEAPPDWEPTVPPVMLDRLPFIAHWRQVSVNATRRAAEREQITARLELLVGDDWDGMPVITADGWTFYRRLLRYSSAVLRAARPDVWDVLAVTPPPRTVTVVKLCTAATTLPVGGIA